MTSKIAVKTGIEEISFGNGGGFTGQVKTYTLTTDDKILDNGTEIKKIDSKKTLELYTKAKKLEGYSFNTPENMYYFIEIKTNGKVNRIVWGSNSTTVDKSVSELYNQLTSTTK